MMNRKQPHGVSGTLRTWAKRQSDVLGQRIISVVEDYPVAFLRGVLRGLLALKRHPGVEQVPDLAPVIIEDGLESYTQRLELLLSRSKRVKEIAVTGPYGSGKSTLLNSFEASHPEYHIINVTLGSFNEAFLEAGEQDKASSQSSGHQDNPLARLERAVLKQLLYRYSDAQNHGSRFVRTPVKMLSKWRTIPLAAVVFTWLLANYFAWLQGKDKALVWLYDNLDKLGEPLSLWPWAAGFILAVPILLLHDLYRFVRRVKISKINPVNGEFELQGDKQESVFNLYLEEVFAFFARSKADVVVFEDMDRFKSTAIFQRLKELNKLINDSDVVPQPVRFIYALKDDLFKGDERAKFFDAIIPVVPVVAGSNAYPQFKRLLDGAGIKPTDNKDPWEILVRTISVYVQDMRLLKNIVSEFLLYRDVLDLADKPERELKLLAFMAYKNLHCDDFALLQTGEGQLAKVFQLKSAVLVQKNHEIEEVIASLRVKEADSAKEHFEYKAEVAELLLYRLSTGADKYMGIHPQHQPLRVIGGVQLFGADPAQITESLFHKAESQGVSTRATVHTANGNTAQANQSLTAILDKVMPNYKDRMLRIDDKDKEEKRARRQKIDQLKRKQSELGLHSLQICLAAFPKEDWFKPLSEMPLLAALLREAYIDEGYGFYLSAYVEGHLTKKDMALIMALKEMKEFESGYRSSNHTDIVSFMTLNSSISPAAYNIGLLEYLAESDDQKHKTLFNSIVHNQFVEHAQGFTRLVTLTQTKSCFSSVVPNWPDIVKSLATSDELDERASVDLLFRIMLVSDWEESDQAPIRSLIEPFDDSLAVLADINGGLDLLDSLHNAGVKLSHAPTVASLHPATKAALEHQVLALNRQTLLASAESFTGKPVGSKSIPYHELPMDSKDFRTFVHGDLVAYVDLLIDGTITNCQEEEVESLLSDRFAQHLPDASKVRLIDGVPFQIEDLDKQELEACLLERLVQKERIALSWDNASVLIDCFNRDRSDENKDVAPYFAQPEETLATFFENPATVMSLEDWVDKSTDEQRERIVRFFEEAPLSPQTYLTYIKLLGYQYCPDHIDVLDQDQLRLLIQHQILPASVAMITELRRICMDNLVLELLEHNEAAFFHEGQWAEELVFSPADLSGLMQDGKLSEAARRALLLISQGEIMGAAPPEYWLDLVLPRLVVTQRLRGIDRINKSALDNEVATVFGLEPAQPQLNLTLLGDLLNHDAIDPDDKLRLLAGQLAHLGETLWPLLDQWQSMPNSLTLGKDGKLTGRVENQMMVYAFCCGLVYHELISSFAEHGDQLSISNKRARQELEPTP